MGSRTYSQCLPRCSRGLHFDLLSTCLHRCARGACICLVAGCAYRFPLVAACYGKCLVSHERDYVRHEEPVAGRQAASSPELDQWRATHKGPLNFNGFYAMPLYLAHSLLAIKSAHSALSPSPSLPYAAVLLKTHASHRKSPPLQRTTTLASLYRAHGLPVSLGATLA